MNSFFSIIVPTYNSDTTIKDCLNAIVSQTFSNFEILIVDGSSTDNTVGVAKSYNNHRIKIYSEKDEGIYDAMNKGVRHAKGEWLYFIGSDDILFSNNVLKDIFTQVNRSDVKMLYGNVIINGNPGWAHDKQVYDGKFSYKKLFKKNIAHQAIFYHRSIFEEIGDYNILYRVCADYDFNLRVFSKFKCKYIDIIVAVFNAGGMSTQQGDIIFGKDFNNNIFKYYNRKIFHPAFAQYRSFMFGYGKDQFHAGKYIEGPLFIFASFYHKLISKIN